MRGMYVNVLRPEILTDDYLMENLIKIERTAQ